VTLSLLVFGALRFAPHGLGRCQHALEATLGTATIALGVWISGRTSVAASHVQLRRCLVGLG
jgi:hypothetical protein